MTAMLNGASGRLRPGTWPRAMSSSKRDAALRRSSSVKYRSMRARGNWSMPAGTGVWVVNTVPAADGLDRLGEGQAVAR